MPNPACDTAHGARKEMPTPHQLGGNFDPEPFLSLGFLAVKQGVEPGCSLVCTPATVS